MASIFNHCVFAGGGSGNAFNSNGGAESDTGEPAEPLSDVNGADMEVRK